ncbi:MAG: PKD domain-containing protein [Thermoplasmata archaeon]|nr:PKD domain-containing protein [Thermoplasmata archaeon]
MKRFVALAIVMVLLSVPIKGVEGDAQSLFFHYAFERPSLLNTENGTIVEMEGMKYTGDGGKPILPVKPLYILLPRGKNVKSIEVKCDGRVKMGNGYEVMRAAYPVIIGSKAIKGKADIPAIYPEKNFEVVGTYWKRGFAILVMNLYPVHYVKDTGEIYYYREMDVKINLEDGRESKLYRGLPEDFEEVATLVENEEAISTYPLSFPESEESYPYVIITSKSLSSSFGQNTFADFAEFKSFYGMEAKIVTVEEIVSDSRYWNSTSLFNDTAAKIRNFIRYAYLNWGTDYVLLAGDADIVPPRTLWAEGEFHQGYYIPSDVYYSCLDGSYNSDKDMRWGEPDDGENGDVDLMAEVYVGRASVDTADEMRNFVSKTTWYEENYDDYVEHVLLVGEDMGWGGDAKWGGNHLDQLIDGCDDGGYHTDGIPSSRFNITKLYDRDRNGYWSKEDLINILNQNMHIVCHAGHSNYVYNMRMVTDDIYSIKNDKPFFAYSDGCMAGGFDEEDCIAEYFTIKTGNAAFAGIWNTRYGWGAGQDPPYDIIDYGSQRFSREFWDAIFGEGIKELGRANADSKEDNIWRINELVMRFCFYELTLFGDPAAVLKDVDFNSPSKPSTPSGEVSGKIRQTYSYESIASDDDGDMLYYLWDFGDGSEKWIGPYAEGQKVTVQHSWSKKGNYEVKVKARDIYGRESEWSDPLPVKMPLHLSFPWLLEMLEKLHVPFWRIIAFLMQS